MAGLGTQSAIERADSVTPRLRMRAPRFYPNDLLVRIWRGPGVGNCLGLLDMLVRAACRASGGHRDRGGSTDQRILGQALRD